MKILKIELQNINSLKSETPVVIDFENEPFKDVGLYAITGATGAGKTTILDAVTIALYHNVPRFKGNKGTLRDVISYGAKDAFSRVQFENEGIVYEANWTMRLASNTGKTLKNPQEEVSLKNLSGNKILASQKRQVITEVTRVTQLDYDQFLRSVMLAQGEFASFLVAKGADKGRLLEQITGEAIYKKIGQGILERKAAEESRLKTLQSKINADDILTEERKTELTERDKLLDIQIKETEKQTTQQLKIVGWYEKHKAISSASEKLNADQKQLDEETASYKNEFLLLEQDEKADPFKELIVELIRNEKGLVVKTAGQVTLDEDVKKLKPQIAILSTLSRKQTEEKDRLDKDYKEWAPKLDAITKLDSNLITEQKNLDTATKSQAELSVKIADLVNNKKQLSIALDDLDAKIKAGETFIASNKFLLDVNTQLSDWTTDLTNLATKKESITKAKTAISTLKTKLKTTNEELTGNKTQLDLKAKEIEVFELEIKSIKEQLAKKNLKSLLDEKTKQQELAGNWKELKGFFETKIEKQKTLDKALKDQASHLSQLESIAAEIKAVSEQIKTKEQGVEDATKILDLEKSIAKYETDRKHLVEGEPCGLCGATEHPFVKGLEQKSVSDAEVALQTRQAELKTRTTSYSDLSIKEAKLKTTIEANERQIKSSKQELKTLVEKAHLLKPTVKLDDVYKIEKELQLASKNLEQLNEAIKETQTLQDKKEKLSEAAKTESKDITSLQSKDATLKSELKSTEHLLVTTQKNIEEYVEECAVIETRLKVAFTPFNYELPSSENTSFFIKEIEKAIENYNKRNKELDGLKAQVGIKQAELKSAIDKEAENTKRNTELAKTVAACRNTITKITAERATVLPMHITVTEKRDSLELVIKELADKTETSKKDLQVLLDTKKEKETLITVTKKDAQDLSDVLAQLNSDLKTRLESSDFDGRPAIEKAILIADDRTKYKALKEQIKDKKLKIQTLLKEQAKAQKQLEETKNFAISEEENNVAFEALKTTNKTLSEQKGEIREAFKKDQEIKDRNSEVYKSIEAQETVCGVWRSLFKIIGNSKDAFNIYVQRLTLKHLLDLANRHLYKLNNRYSLKMEKDYKPKEELDFNLIDHYQTDQARLVDTSSGGEKFIISLALALGLSDLASKNVKIDSLFIDEGFGTLDGNTLETVISTLETLQSQGKMIGIISHVENLKERIPTQIKIIKKSNGVSAVEVS